MEESHKPRRCEALTKSTGRQCQNWAMAGRKLCMCHDPRFRADLIERGKKVGKLPKPKLKDISAIDSVEAMLDFARKRMYLISQKSSLTAQAKEELLIRWSGFVLPILKDRDDLKKRLDKLERESGRI